MMENTQPPRPTAPVEKRQPGRPRSETTRRAILEAALDLLDGEPYRNISIDKIAAKAKVGKQSIYRWWPSKAELILEAYLDRATASVPKIASTGDCLTDFESTLKRLCQALSGERAQKSFRSFVAEAQLDDEFRPKFYQSFVARRDDILAPVLEQGRSNGQIRPDLDIAFVLDVTLGAIWFRLLSGAPRKPDESYIEDICDLLRASIARNPEDRRRPDRTQVGMFEA